MNTITDDQIAEIETLAGHATPGPWGLTLDRDLSVASSEWGLFDVRQDQPNFVVDAHYAAAANPKSVLALIARLREAERWKADASQVLNPLLDYAYSLGLAKLGHSVTEALIEDHKRLREAERDAARYRWILKHYGEFHGDRPLASIALQHGSLDAAIDAAMLSAREAAE